MGIQMKRKELINTLMMTSNWEKCFDLHGLYKNIYKRAWSTRRPTEVIIKLILKHNVTSDWYRPNILCFFKNHCRKIRLFNIFGLSGEKVETNMRSILSRIKATNCAIFYLRHIFLICVIFPYLGHFLFNEFLFEICHVVQTCEADYLTLSARGPSLYVRIWRQQTSDSDV